jgi:hypothetical protein
MSLNSNTTDFTKKQIKLQNEIASLANTYAVLRDLYLENNSTDLQNAMDLVLKRMKIAEKELDITIEARDLHETIPVVSLKSSRKSKI